MEKKLDKVFEKVGHALADYIKLLGGSVVLLGSTKVGKNPGSLKYSYFIQFDVVGKMPIKKVK